MKNALQKSASPGMRGIAPREAPCVGLKCAVVLVTGVGPPMAMAPPPPSGDDEDGSEEPPEAREFMQELSRAGGVGAGAWPPATAPNPVGGPGDEGGPQFGLLTAVATGILSIGARAVEGTAELLDRLLSTTHAGSHP